MEIKVCNLRKKDFNKARKFAIEGMHLHWYAHKKWELYFYSKYFWYLEISRASIALGAYQDGELVGVLLADINDSPKVFKSIRYRIWINVISFFINLGYKEASDSYDNANKEILAKFKDKITPDGELNYFAVNPNIKGKGIGTLLLNAFEKKVKGKIIYLYTDSGSTYQFYEKRGFEKSEEKDITLEIKKKNVDLTCYLFSKKIE